MQLVTFYNPNKKDMTAMIQEYLDVVDKEELNNILETLKTKKYSRLEINLIFPFGYKINEWTKWNSDSHDWRKTSVNKRSNIEKTWRISQLVENLKKANDKVILKIHAEYEVRQAEKANAFLTDLIISKIADLLGGLDAIGKRIDKW